MENQELQLAENLPAEITFGNSAQFEHSQRVAKMLTSSSLLPDVFKGNIANTMIALEMANRIGASPLMVMQNLYIVHGKPSWSSTFIISAINACGRFSPLRFEMTGKCDTLECYAWAYDKRTNDKLIGVNVTMEMAKAEGWVSKAGSKWKTMPELMIRYRSAAFFGRLYAPDILMGMHTAEEVDDFTLMITDEQTDYLTQLMETSTLDEQRLRAINFKLANGMSQGEYMQFKSELQQCQVDPANPSATDIKNKVKEISNAV